MLQNEWISKGNTLEKYNVCCTESKSGLLVQDRHFRVLRSYDQHILLQVCLTYVLPEILNLHDGNL